LNPGSKVHIYQDNTDLGEAEAPDSTYDFPVPPLAPNTIIAATQELCGNWSKKDDCIKVKVDAHQGGLPAPHIAPPLYECGAVVHVTNIHPGSTVFVNSTFLGAPIGIQTVYATSADIPVSPQLLKGDHIFALEVGCGHKVQSTPSVPVTAVPKPQAPRIVEPVDDCMRSVSVTNVLVGARVDLYGDSGWLGSADAGASTVDVPVQSGSLHAGGHVRACQHICKFKPVCGEPARVNPGTCRDVVTHKNNNHRTGEFIYETILTPTLLKSGRFGWLVDRQVNGDIYAQPLFVHGVVTANHGTKNLVFVATSTNDVYAFDADDTNPDPAGLIWRWNNANDPFRMLTSAEICQETRGSVGITSTPVIDPASNSMWFVTRRTFPPGIPIPPGQADGDNWLHAIDIRSGNELPHSPVKITGSVNSPRHVDFDHTVQRNRPALLLNKGTLWVAFGTFSCDGGDYHGWVMAYKSADLSQLGTYCTSADGGQAGIWQSGHGLVGHEDGSVFFETGNEAPPAALGDSFVKLRLGGPQGIIEVGHFTPDNARALRDGRDANGNFIVPPAHQYGTVGDTDLGSGGPVLLPANRITGGGKQGRLYVVDAANMQLTQDTQKDPLRILGQGFQHFHNTYLSHPPIPGQPIPVEWYAAGEMYGPNIHGAPIFWSGTNWIYHMPEKDYMQAYPYDPMGGTLGHVHSALSNVRPVDGMPGGFSSVSSNGAQDGIIWTLFPQVDGQWAKGPGDFVAFDATTLEVLWADHSTTYGFAKFCPPTIAGGKVFRPTFAPLIPDGANTGGDNPTGYKPGALAIYGVLPKPHPWPPPHGWWPGLLRNFDRLHPLEQRHLTFGIWLGKPEGPAENVDDARRGQFRRYSRQVRGVRNHSAAIELDPKAGGPSCHNSKPGAVATVHSALYWSEATGAHFLSGAILENWLTHGGPAGALGYPTEDERPSENGQGRVATFENGTITWYPGKGCTITHRNP
jgi:hypothetical protein